MDLEAAVNISGLEVWEVPRVVNILDLEAMVNIPGLNTVEVVEIFLPWRQWKWRYIFLA